MVVPVGTTGVSRLRFKVASLALWWRFWSSVSLVGDKIDISVWAFFGHCTKTSLALLSYIAKERLIKVLNPHVILVLANFCG